MSDRGFEEVSDDALVDAYQHYNSALIHVEETKWNLFRDEIEDELRDRGFDPDKLPAK